jgi:hypothetical protein
MTRFPVFDGADDVDISTRAYVASGLWELTERVLCRDPCLWHGSLSRCLAFGFFVKEESHEHGKSPESKQKAQEGRDLRNEGRVEDGKAPKTTKPGTGHPEK